MKNNRPIIILLVAVLCLAALCGCEDKTSGEDELRDLSLVGFDAVCLLYGDYLSGRTYIGTIESVHDDSTTITTFSNCSAQLYSGAWVSEINGTWRHVDLSQQISEIYPSSTRIEARFLYEGKYHHIIRETYYRSLHDYDIVAEMIDDIDIR